MSEAPVIQVGQVLDKYELLERVGQGGMAVVYRGLDRSLKRVVAVKVLHKHLADYQEARDRFEREAQAVAKLRHENILEIFDYAARSETEAYIVTEFIDGQTLRQVCADRPLAYPEIGAMLILQVGRALAHAHAHGILHRDVKPENIMIRADGVVKLMDFGISHMVDLERLTVTGQLLGSPAYMAPEHVEGRPIDYRTDVFAAGIVLYQLTVGKLPFEGKNPHEVLKRIAECKFVDPRMANPRIGNRLGKIILRAMAAQPADRFQAIGEMVVTLEAYLDESGLPSDKAAAELARYFAAPAAYEAALSTRLIDHLTRRGQQLLDRDERAAALDVFDRVLTLDANNEKVIAILDGINRRVRLKAIGLGALAALAIGGGAFAIHRQTRALEPAAPPPPGEPGTRLAHTITAVAPDDPPPPPPEVPDDALLAEVPVDAAASGATTGVVGVTGPRLPTGPDAGAAPMAREVTVVVSPARGSRVDFGDGRWIDVPPDDGRLTHALDGEAMVRVQNPCCEEQARAVSPGAPVASFNLRFRAATVTVRCPASITGTPWEVSVKIDGMPAQIGERANVFFGDSLVNDKVVGLEFVTSSADAALRKKWTQKRKVRPGETIEEPCKPPP